MNVPLAIYLENNIENVIVTMDSKNISYEGRYPTAPVKIEVDPQFDVFRKLDKAEVPPSLSQIFGASDGMIILPKNSSLLEDYKSLAETWKQTQEAQGKSLQVVMDDEIDQLPSNKSAWIIGFENKFADVFDIQKDYRASMDNDQTELITRLTSEGSLVFTIPNPDNNAFTLGLVGTNVKQAIPGLARLLAHYGKYSYLGFEGERPNNVLKGNFPALNSPLNFTIPYDGKYLETKAILEPDKALIE